MSKYQVKLSEEWLRSLESFKARDLVVSIIRNARVQRKVIKFRLASKRAEVILGSKDAGQIFELQAQTHMKRLISGLQRQKTLFTRFFKEMKPYEERWIEYVKSGKIKEHFEYARNFMVLRAIYSDGRPKDAEYLIKQFDTRIDEIQTLASIDEVEGYVLKSFERITLQMFDWNEFWWKFCVVLYTYSSEIGALLIIWSFYCLWAAFQDAPEVTCAEWWDNAMWSACGVPHGDFDWDWFEEVLERM